MAPEIRHVELALKQNRLGDAFDAGNALVSASPRSGIAWFILGVVQQRLGRFEAMLECAQKAHELSPHDTRFTFQKIDALVHCCEIKRAQCCLQELEQTADLRTMTVVQLGDFYTSIGKHDDAARNYARAVNMEPDNPAYTYNLATSSLSLGDLEQAEALINKAITTNRLDFDAYYTRATLRRQSENSNHIAEIRHLLASIPKHSKGALALHYALGKEYEDLGEYNHAFEQIALGADRRNRMLSYTAQADIAAMQRLRQKMDAAFCAQVANNNNTDGPIFIVGLPRTGTTLADRILSSHSRVESMGEINDFSLHLMRLAPGEANKALLIDRALNLDYSALGEAYRRSTRERTPDASMRIDKTPANFLNIGLIARALPEAKIIHLRRHPLDSCFAIFKTLFRMGYPYSYSLENLGQYFIAYHRLMDHWQACLPGRILDIAYEDIVDESEITSKKMLSFCGLEWEENCLDFHRQTTAVATASAAQVRQPIYSSSVAKWRHYSKQLAPLREQLAAANINIE